MIEIVKSPKSDCHRVDGKIDRDNLWLSMARHMDNVNDGMEFFANKLLDAGAAHMEFFANKLLDAGAAHDYTKMTMFDEYHEAVQSGKKNKSEWYQKHKEAERHHIIEQDYNDVNLIDVLEYISDCVMAGSVRSNDPQGINIKISDAILQKAFQNTLQMLKKEVVVKEVAE